MSPFEYYLFPHTTLPEKDYRHLAVLIPHLHLLQITGRPQTPEWGQERFATLQVVSEEQALEIRSLSKEYRNFADLIGDGAVLSSMSYRSDEGNRRESRFRIQNILRSGKEEPELSDEQIAKLEAALFMEMAGDLDRQSMELESDLARAERLDKEFRNILGITGEEELEEPIELDSSLFVEERGHGTFMLTKRVAFWLRLFCSIEPAGTPVLVAVAPEVVDEILDPLSSIDGLLAASSSEWMRIPLASIPALSHLEAGQFESIMDDLKSSNMQHAYQESMEKVLKSPEETSLAELRAIEARLQERLKAFLVKEAAPDLPVVKLTLIYAEPLTIEGLWRTFDKLGARISLPERACQQPVRVLLCETTSTR